MFTSSWSLSQWIPGHALGGGAQVHGLLVFTRHLQAWTRYTVLGRADITLILDSKSQTPPFRKTV